MSTPDPATPDPLAAGGLPTPMPAAELLGVAVVTDGADEVVCRLTIREEHLNQGLIGHGGVLFVLADTALGLLANPPDLDRPWVGTAFAVQLLRGVVIGDVVVATARREHRSARLQSLVARLTRARDDALVGTVTAQLMPGPAPRPEADPDPERRPADAGAPLPRALRAAARREGEPGDDEVNDDEVDGVLYLGDQPVGFTAGGRRWLHPRWRAGS